MFCGKCGSKLPDGAKFCGNCGVMVNGIVSKPAVNKDKKVIKERTDFKQEKIDIPKVKFTEVIPCIFEWVSDFGEGLAAVQDVGDSGKIMKTGFINNKGKFVLEISFKNASSFNEGLCAISNGEKWGFIDKTGNLVIPCEYNFSMGLKKKFQNGYCLCKKDDDFVLIDKYGKEIYYKNYDEVEYFPEYGYLSVTKKGKKGLCNIFGKEIVPCNYETYNTFNFEEDVILVDKDLYYSKGEKVEFKYDRRGRFIDGLICVKDKELYGFCNKNGELVIPCEYLNATDFSDGYAFVKKQSGWVSIDKNNNVIATSNIYYTSISDNVNGRAFAEKSNDDHGGFIDKYFNEITEFKYLLSTFRDYFFAKTSIGELCGERFDGIIDRNGKEILQCKYDWVEINNFNNKGIGFEYGVAKVEHNKKQVYFDLNTGKELFTPGIYDSVGYFYEGYAVVKKGNKYGYISCLPNAKISKLDELGVTKIDEEFIKNAEKEAKIQTKKAENIEEGSIINFGHFNGISIKWRVLNVVKSRRKALLISKDILTILPFNNSGYSLNTDYMNVFEKIGHKIIGGEIEVYTNEIVWADSYIRSWLNTKFYNQAFDINEQKQILKTNINTFGKRTNHTYGGEDTSDKVFLLSIDELKKYMYQGNDCAATYQGLNAGWWLRSPGQDNECVASVDNFGKIFMRNYHFAKLGVRPVINIKF